MSDRVGEEPRHLLRSLSDREVACGRPLEHQRVQRAEDQEGEIFGRVSSRHLAGLDAGVHQGEDRFANAIEALAIGIRLGRAEGLCEELVVLGARADRRVQDAGVKRAIREPVVSPSRWASEAVAATNSQPATTSSRTRSALQPKWLKKVEEGLVGDVRALADVGDLGRLDPSCSEKRYAPDSEAARAFVQIAEKIVRKLAVLAETTPKIADANITWVTT